MLKGRIYLTSYSGDQSKLTRHVVCLDRKSGKILWKQDFKARTPESRYQGRLRLHGFATATATTDGTHLYVFFGKSGVYCLKLEDGSQVWHKVVGDRTDKWGSSNSPVLHGNLVIVNASIESGTLFGLDKKTGKEIWKVTGIRKCWSSPVLVTLPDGNVELVLSKPRRIVAFDPATGKDLWNCEGIPDGYVCPSVVSHKGIVYAIGGRKNTAIAVKAGGRGNVTESHRLWKTGMGSNVSSPVYHNGHIYWVHEKQGTANCLDAKTGKTVYQKRLAPRPGLIYSSVTVADGKLYAVSQHNGTYVLAAKPEFQLLAHNTFADDDSLTNACPVISNGQLLLRSDKYLYCIGKKAK